MELWPFETAIYNKFTLFITKTKFFYSIMGEISPVRGKNVEPERFAQFRIDLGLLLESMTQEELGKGMGVERSNINKYIKGTHPITKGFISKFYKAWSYQLNLERPRPEVDGPEDSPAAQVKEPTLADVMTILQRIERKIDRQAGPPNEEN